MFIASWNQPGYMPETDPEEFDDFDDAKGYVYDEIDRTLDNAHLTDDRDAMENCDRALDDIDVWRESDGDYWQTYCDGYVYWITRGEG